jgi:hypothetical protein
MKKYNDQELAELIGLVETQFAEHLKKCETTSNDLTKSEPVVTPVETVVAPVVEAAPVETPVAKTEIDYSEEDLKEMDTLYKSMNKSEAEAHYKSLKKAIFGDVEETEIKKSEQAMDLVKSELDLAKSENVKVTTENAELKKSLDKLSAVISKIVKTVPERKAITEIQFVDKTDLPKKDEVKLTKSEIANRLSLKIREGKLNKNEMDLVSKYYNNGSIESIKHLL